MREARRSTCFKYTIWILAMQCSWTLMSIRMNPSFHGGKSLPARQEDSKLQILSWQDMYFYYYEIHKLNEVVNGGVTILFFVVTNLVCVPKKRNLSIFRGIKGAWKHIRTLEWKLKRNVAPVPSEMVRSLAQEEGVDPYHLDLVLLPLFF